jgi:uncharacterized protein YjdB
MVNRLNIFTAMALCTAALLFPAAAEAQEKRVAVLEPEGDATVTQMNKKLVRSVAKEIITDTNLYKSVARNNASIDSLLKTQNFQRTDLSDPSKAKKLGELLGADLICAVELHAGEGEILIDCEIVDAQSGANFNAGVLHLENYSVASIKTALEPKINQILAGIGASRRVRVAGISLNKSALSLEAGSTETLFENISPKDASDKSVGWVSDKPNVASVSQNGTLTAVAPGTAIVSAKTNDGNFTAVCRVTVTAAKIRVTGLGLNKTLLSLEAGYSERLTETITPLDASDKSVEWASSNPSIAQVAQNGTITAVASGMATISAKTVDGGHIASCSLTVMPAKISVAGISLDIASFSIEARKTATLTETITPHDASDKSVEWTSDNPSVARVAQNGLITALSAGTATITAKANDGGFTASCSLSVTPAIIRVTGIRLNKRSLNIEAGKTETLVETIMPFDASDKGVEWVSDNPSVAQVTQNSRVAAIAPGTATITAKTHDNGFAAACIVTVTIAKIRVTGLSLNKNKLSLEIGTTETLLQTIAPYDASDTSVEWESDDTTVASVSQSGTISAIALGSATITAISTDGGYIATCSLTVTVARIRPTSISLNKNALSLEAGKTETLHETIRPFEADNKSVEWTSDNPGVANVSQNGLVAALALGRATITARTNDEGHTATCTVTVTAPIIRTTGISLNKNSMSIEAGGTETLTETVVPLDASNKSVEWASGNPHVATIGQNGTITAIAPGTATITAKTSDNGFTAACAVTVTAPIIRTTGISLNKNSMSIEAGATETLTETVVPSDASDKSVEWKSDNLNVANVSQSGMVTGASPGTATITAMTTDGGYVVACNVMVAVAKIRPTSISLNKSALSLEVGKTETLSETVMPDNAEDKSVEWTSSDLNVAQVTPIGRVAAVASGTATIVAKTIVGGNTAACIVTVTAARIRVTGISLNENSLSLEIGKTAWLSEAIAPFEASDKSVEWKSDNPSVAQVSTVGAISAVAPGRATISAVTNDGGHIATCNLTVVPEKIPAASISLNKNALDIEAGQIEQLIETIAPFDASDKSVEWVSSDPSVASVSQNGRVSALAPGTAIITVKALDGGNAATCAVTVSAARIRVTSISLDKNTLSLEVGKTEPLFATVRPFEAYDKSVEWVSSDPSVAQVSQDGTVTAIAPGSATITVKTAKDGRHAAYCIVNVKTDSDGIPRERFENGEAFFTAIAWMLPILSDSKLRNQ